MLVLGIGAMLPLAVMTLPFLPFMSIGLPLYLMAFNLG